MDAAQETDKVNTNTSTVTRRHRTAVLLGVLLLGIGLGALAAHLRHVQRLDARRTRVSQWLSVLPTHIPENGHIVVELAALRELRRHGVGGAATDDSFAVLSEILARQYLWQEQYTSALRLEVAAYDARGESNAVSLGLIRFLTALTGETRPLEFLKGGHSSSIFEVEDDLLADGEHAWGVLHDFAHHYARGEWATAAEVVSPFARAENRWWSERHIPYSFTINRLAAIASSHAGMDDEARAFAEFALLGLVNTDRSDMIATMERIIRGHD